MRKLHKESKGKSYQNQTSIKNYKFWVLASFWPLYILEKSHKISVDILQKENSIRKINKKISSRLVEKYRKTESALYDTFGSLVSFVFPVNKNILFAQKTSLNLAPNWYPIIFMCPVRSDSCSYISNIDIFVH